MSDEEILEEGASALIDSKGLVVYVSDCGPTAEQIRAFKVRLGLDPNIPIDKQSKMDLNRG